MSRIMPTCLLIVAAAFLACQYNPFAHRFVTEEPDWLEVEGVYVMTFQSVVYGEDRDGLESDPPCIVVGEHNRYRAVRYPVIQRDNGDWRFVDSIDKTGDWRGDTVGSVGTNATSETKRYWGLRLDPHPIPRPELDADSLHAAAARGDNDAVGEILSKSSLLDYPRDPALGLNEGIFELIFTYGDGDAGQVLIFTKNDDETACRPEGAGD